MNTFYSLHAPDGIGAVISELGATLEIERGPSRKLDRTYLDTFDWRLYRKDRALWIDGPGRLRLAHDGRTDGQECAATWSRAVDLPDGPVRAELAAITEPRCLRPLVRIRGDETTWSVLDGRRKTIARLAFVDGRAEPTDGSDGAPLLTVRADGLLGYEKALERVVELLDRSTHTAAETRGLLSSALAAIERQPVDYTNKVRVRFEPREPAVVVTRRVFRRLWQIVGANLDGTLDGDDIEFLHDFRVAVRRTRSWQGQTKSLFAGPEFTVLREELRWLGRISGPLRDLDVFTDQIDRQLAAFDPESREVLADFVAEIHGRRGAAQAALVKELRSDRFSRLSSRWQAFIEKDEIESTTPAGAFLRKRIARLVSRIGAQTKKHHLETNVAALHQTRIDCKKLRYLLDVAASLYDREEADTILGRLKKLQDRLGEFNDLEVQQERIVESAREMAAANRLSFDASITIGRWVERSSRRGKKTRLRAVEALSEFCREPGVRHLAGAKTT